MEIVLCLYTIEEDCILPFVKYIVREKSFPSFIFQKEMKEEFELRLKNQCLLKVMEFIKNIHIQPINFDRIYKGFLIDSTNSMNSNKIYFFYDLSDYEYCKNGNSCFCIIDEILKMNNDLSRLFSQHSFLKFIFRVNNGQVINKKIPLPRLYYSKNYTKNDDETIKRFQHSIYGAFYYFCQISISKTPKYAVFDHLCDNKLIESIQPVDCINYRMFVFKENDERVLCVKNILDFQII
jgi:hypothetical protein